MKTLLALLCLSLVCCASFEQSFEKKAGITIGQSISLAGDLVQGYEAARAANRPSGKTVSNPTP